jgi:hypothetical protein
MAGPHLYFFSRLCFWLHLEDHSTIYKHDLMDNISGFLVKVKV